MRNLLSFTPLANQLRYFSRVPYTWSPLMFELHHFTSCTDLERVRVKGSNPLPGNQIYYIHTVKFPKIGLRSPPTPSSEENFISNPPPQKKKNLRMTLCYSNIFFKSSGYWIMIFLQLHLYFVLLPSFP